MSLISSMQCILPPFSCEKCESEIMQCTIKESTHLCVFPAGLFVFLSRVLKRCIAINLRENLAKLPSLVLKAIRKEDLIEKRFSFSWLTRSHQETWKPCPYYGTLVQYVRTKNKQIKYLYILDPHAKVEYKRNTVLRPAPKSSAIYFSPARLPIRQPSVGSKDQVVQTSVGKVTGMEVRYFAEFVQYRYATGIIGAAIHGYLYILEPVCLPFPAQTLKGGLESAEKSLNLYWIPLNTGERRVLESLEFLSLWDVQCKHFNGLASCNLRILVASGGIR